MKKGSSIIGVRSESLHDRITKYVQESDDENVTMSSIVRDALREKMDRLEKAQASGQIGSDGKQSPEVRAKQNVQDEIRKRRRGNASGGTSAKADK